MLGHPVRRLRRVRTQAILKIWNRRLPQMGRYRNRENSVVRIPAHPETSAQTTSGGGSLPRTKGRNGADRSPTAGKTAGSQFLPVRSGNGPEPRLLSTGHCRLPDPESDDQVDRAFRSCSASAQLHPGAGAQSARRENCSYGSRLQPGVQGPAMKLPMYSMSAYL